MEENEFQLTGVRFNFENCERVIVPIENFSQLILNGTDVLQSNYETLQYIDKIIVIGNITFEENHNIGYKGLSTDKCPLRTNNPLNRFMQTNDLDSIDLMYENETEKIAIELTVKWYYENEDSENYKEQYKNNNVIVTLFNYYTVNIEIKPYTKIYSLNNLLDNTNQYIGNEFEDVITKDRYIFSDVNEFHLPTLMPVSSRCKHNFSSGKYARINCYSLFEVQYYCMKIKKTDFRQLIDYINLINIGILELKLNDLNNETNVQTNTAYYTSEINTDYILIGEYSEIKLFLQRLHQLDVKELNEWYIK